MNEAARWLKRMREAEGLSYRQLADAVGSSHQTIADAETKGKATTNTWAKLAEHYKESVLQVLYWAKILKSPPSNKEIILELQNKLIIYILEKFPESEWESVLKSMASNAEYLLEIQKKSNNEAHRPKNP